MSDLETAALGRFRILGAVRSALAERAGIEHPGAFAGWGRPASDDAVTAFSEAFEAAGGTVVRLGSVEDARAWLRGFAEGFTAAAVGPTVPPDLRPELPSEAPESAPLGVSIGLVGVAETGSVLLGAGDGQRVQLLPPVHVIWLPVPRVRATLAEALAALDLSGGSGPSAVGIHSGPSKSADIGRVLVKGVHGPGEVVVALLD